MAKGERRSGAETQKLCQQVDKLVAGGAVMADALRDVDLSGSVYRRYLTHKKNGTVTRGAISVGMLPPRPMKKKNGKGFPKQVNMNDVASVAKRITALDRKLATFTELHDERKRMAAHLMSLLKG